MRLKHISFACFIFFSFAGVQASLISTCGEYQLRGKLVKDLNSKEKNIFNVKYIVLENTKSQAQFVFKDEKAFMPIAAYLNKLTEIKVKITSQMNGTKGIISEVLEVKTVFPNPLKLEDDIVKISESACIK